MSATGEAPAQPAKPTSPVAAGGLAWVVSIAIIFFAAGLRLAGITKSIWIDEASTLMHMCAADFMASLRSDIHPPLYFFLLKAATRVTDSFTVLRLLSLACGLGAVSVLCFFFRGRDRLAAWIAGLLLAALPGFTANSQELRQYALLSLTLSLALFFAWRLLQSPRSTGALVGMTLALAAAASTHLITVFFMGALALVLGWHLRREPFPVLARIGITLIPAACLIGFFKLVFVLPQLQAAQWWMPPVSVQSLMNIFGEASGWNAILWLSDAFERHVAHTGLLVIVAAAAGIAFVCWTAWGRRETGGAHLFLAMALLYWGAMIGYSMVSLPVLWPRTVLPGLLPFVLGLGLGIATHPVARRRALATATVVLLALVLTLPWLRGLAFQPNEDLRGFDGALRAAAEPGTLVVLVGEVEIGIAPYWPEYRQARLVRLKQLNDPKIPTDLATALDQLSPGHPALLVYRADFYLQEQRKSLDAVIARLASRLSAPETVWSKDGYNVVRFAPAGAKP